MSHQKQHARIPTDENTSTFTIILIKQIIYASWKNILSEVM